MTTTAAPRSPSPSPPPNVPQPTAPIPSRRFAALRRLYTDALRASLATNSYPNFAACFPTPATYCPRALEGVWRQLNTKLEEECLKDFEKICEERDIERGLGTWERLVEDARARKAQHSEASSQGIGSAADSPLKPVHLISAQELYAAHLTPTLVRAEQELQTKLDNVQQGNQDKMVKIEQQRTELQRLIEQMERIVEDVEGAAKFVEGDEVRKELSTGVQELANRDEDIKMTG